MRDLLVTVVVTHRSDLNARFAEQLDDSAGGTFIYDPDDPADQIALKSPQPDPDVTTDMFFPQAWLVMLDSVHPGGGQARCSGQVARLLPEGAFFVVARTNGPLLAGTAHQVLSSTYDPGTPSLPAVLQITRGGGGARQDVLAWVVPPAYERGSGTFRTRSPVVGVALRRISVQ